jgi:hypothetical protein
MTNNKATTVQEVMDFLREKFGLPDNVISIRLSVGVNEPLQFTCTYIHRASASDIKAYLRNG